MRLRHAAVAACLMALAVTAAAAQTGGMKVRVYDAKDSSSLPGASVTLSHNAGAIKTTTELTDADGYVLFPVIRAGGGYSIEVYFPGYAKVRLDNQRVKIQEMMVIPVGLSEQIQEKVEVVARKEVVDLGTGTSTGAKFSDEFIQDLPIQGRAYQNVLTLSPAVSDPDGDGNPNVAGARQGDFKTNVGGVANTDPLTGLQLNFINADSIEEISVVTAGAGVEVGRAQGGYAEILQKQGTNEFEGRAGILYRSSKLDGDGASDLEGSRVPEYDSFQPSIQLSGPILKDRLWYFLSHEYLKESTPINILTEVAVSESTRPVVSDLITWQVSPRNQLNFQFQQSPITVTNVGVSSARGPESSQRREAGGPQYTVTWTAAQSSKLVVRSVAAYQDNYANILPMTGGLPNECVSGLDTLAQADCLDLNTGERSGSYFLTHRDTRERFTLSSSAELYGGKFWGATHQFKFGFVAESERYAQTETRNPRMTYQVVEDLQGGDGGASYGLVNAEFAVPRTSSAETEGLTWAVYASDELRPRNNVQIEFGFRFSREQITSAGLEPMDPAAEFDEYLRLNALTPGQTNQNSQRAFTAYQNVGPFLDQLAAELGITNPADVANRTSGITRNSQFYWQRRRDQAIDIVNDNFEPNLSVSWDPWSDGKTKFAASAARHYGLIPLNRPALEIQPPTANVTLRTASNGQVTLGPDGGPVGLQGINPALDTFAVSRDLKTPYQDEYSFKFERELTPEMALRLTYVNRDFQDQHQDVDINHEPADFGYCNQQVDLNTPSLIYGPNGRLDDCVGRFEPGLPGEGSTDDSLVNVPDGYLDTYVLNPVWGQIFRVGNYNTQKYEALILQLERRLYRGWQLDASYTLSEASGQAEDFDSQLGDDQTNTRDEQGLLSYNQTHSIKLNGTTVSSNGIQVGGTILWQSGLPYSIVNQSLSTDATPPAQIFGTLVPADSRRVRRQYPTGQRNDEENESFWTFNLRIAKDFNLKGGKTLGLSADVFNLLNDDSLRVFEELNTQAIGAREFGRTFQVGVSFAF